MYAMHVYCYAQFECHSLNYVPDIKKVKSKKNSPCITIGLNDRYIVDLYTQDIANGLLIEIEPVSATSLVGVAINGMGTYCLYLTSCLTDAQERL